MPWISRKDLEELERKEFIYDRCQRTIYWIEQDFFRIFMKKYLDGDDIARIRDEFNRELENHIEERFKEKLDLAKKLVDEVGEISRSNPFHKINILVEEFKGLR